MTLSLQWKPQCCAVLCCAVITKEEVTVWSQDRICEMSLNPTEMLRITCGLENHRDPDYGHKACGSPRSLPIRAPNSPA